MTLDLAPLWISLKTSALATVITFFLGIAAAWWMFGYRGRGKAIIDGILTLPLVLPPTVAGFLLLLLFGRYSPLGQLLKQVGVTIIFSWTATVIAATVVAFPLMYRATLGAFEQVNPDLIHAAQTLGASPLRVFRQVVLPLAIPGIVAATILSFARALGEFGATLMLAGNIPGKTQTIPTAIFFAAEAGRMDQASIWVVIIIAIALATIAALNYWSTYQRSPASRRRNCTLREPISSGRQYPVPTLSVPPAPLAATHPPELLVDIYKHLPNFSLQVNFTTHSYPLGLLGASGSGKSMLLRCIAGLETPTRGCIVLNQRVLFDAVRGINLPTHDRKVGMVFQNYALFPHMTVGQNIAFGLRHLPKAERSRRMTQQIQAMQLNGLADRYPRELSGGQQQRVALARALATNPEVLLLDEPFSALDTHLRSQLERQLIQTLSTYSGIALFVTHNLEEAYRVCERLMVMANGRAIAQDLKQRIFEHPSTFTVARLTGCKNFSRAVSVTANSIRAIDWDCTLEVDEPIPPNLAHVGLRAHHITFLPPYESRSHSDRHSKYHSPSRRKNYPASVHSNPSHHDADHPVEDSPTFATSLLQGDRRDQALTHTPNLGETTPEENAFTPTATLLSPAPCPLSPQTNIVHCWLTEASETPHRVTLYLNLHKPPTHTEDYHLQAEVYKEKWDQLKHLPMPWRIKLDPKRLMLLADDRVEFNL